MIDCIPRRNGFTLMELLAANVLAALLMVAVFGVLGSFGRSEAATAAIERARTEAAEREATVRLIERDLVNATRVKVAVDHILVQGHGSLERSALVANDLPVTVAYAINEAGGRRWLFRAQRSRLTDGWAWSELVCPEVEGIELWPAEGRWPATSAAGPDGWRRLPEHVWLAIRFGPRADDRLERLINLR
jgi:prepilin-type N-terminal cleavage/methylation domain-containing protein